MGSNDYNLNEHHRKCLDALRVLNKICGDNNIEYYLIAGSALGAVRHHGFIPWDDDIDIGIKIQDELELERLLREFLPPQFIYKSIHTDNNYPRLHGKILFNGRTCIDVFPLIRLSDSNAIAKIQWTIRRRLEKLFYRKIGYIHEGERDSIVKLSRIVSYLVPKALILKLLDMNAFFYANSDTQRWINIYSIYSMEKEIIDSSHLQGGEIVQFEDITVPIVNNYDKYLKHLYGDYWKIPPEEDRHPAHEELF